MISYEDALKTAKELKPDIDGCTEYEKGYVFGSTNDENFDGGAGHTPCVILKSDGSAVSMPYFIMHGPGEEIRSFEL